MKNIYIFLTIVFLLGLFLRFYELGKVPYGFHRDEAFLGYNAYSLLMTWRDMTGYFLPLHLESFLYSPAGYSYFIIPFIALFGLTVFSVRAASALFGAVTVIILFFFVQELFFQYKTRGKIALFTSSLFALSPWSVNLSRTATENTIVTFFIIFASWLFLLYVRNKGTHFLFLSFVFFNITLFIYQAPRAFLPFLILLLLFFFLDFHKDRKKILLSALLFLLLIVVPLLFVLFSKNLSLRIRTISLFSSEQTKLVLEEQLRQDGVEGIYPVFARYFHNKLLYYGIDFSRNYFKHLSYDFLFTDSGFPDRYRVPVSGLIYFTELPFLIIGLWLLVNKNKKIGLFLLGWVFVSPLGSALTSDDVPNLQRTLFLYPALTIFTAYGFISLETLQKNFLVKFLYGLVIVSFFYNVSYYFHQYFLHVNLYRPWYRQDGYQELVKKVEELTPHYTHIVITNRESAPAIFFLFFQKYNPLKFQEETKNSTFRDFDRIAFSKFMFSEEECPLRLIQSTDKPALNSSASTLYVNSGFCKDEKGVKTLNEVRRKDGSVVFKIVVPEKIQ